MKRWIIIYIAIICIICGCTKKQEHAVKISAEKTLGRPFSVVSALPADTIGAVEFIEDSGVQKFAEYELYRDSISLYVVVQDGKQALLVDWNGIKCLFDITLVTPAGISVYPYFVDIDSDGSLEIIVINQAGSGTGVCIDELHIIERCGDDLQDNKLPVKQMADAFAELIYTNNKKSKISLGMHTLSRPENTLPSVSWGDVVGFSFANGLFVECGVGSPKLADCGVIEYFGSLKADIMYSDGLFLLSNLQLREVT